MPTTDEVRDWEREGDLKRRIFFLEEKVEELQKVRGGLENEIASARVSYKAKLDEEHSKRMAELATEYQEHGKKQDEQQKYLDNYLIRLDKQAEEQKAVAKGQADREAALEKQESEFTAKKEYAVGQLQDQQAALDKKEKLLESREQAVSLTTSSQIKDRSELDAKAAAIEKEKERIAIDTRKEMEIGARNQALYDDAQKALARVEEEKKSLQEVLADIEAKKKDLIALSVYKDELVKIQQAQAELELKEKSVFDKARLIDKREISVLERETAMSEKEKYLEIKERDVTRLMDKKIAILEKLRKGE